MTNENKSTDYYPRRSKWLRGTFIIVILVGFGFAEALLWFLAFIQFFWVVFKGEPNQYIQRFSAKLLVWTSTAISFCLWNSDLAPFPFAPWPDDVE